MNDNDSIIQAMAAVDCHLYSAAVDGMQCFLWKILLLLE